jgi:hypothetical protein
MHLLQRILNLWLTHIFQTNHWNHQCHHQAQLPQLKLMSRLVLAQPVLRPCL